MLYYMTAFGTEGLPPLPEKAPNAYVHLCSCTAARISTLAPCGYICIITSAKRAYGPSEHLQPHSLLHAPSPGGGSFRFREKTYPRIRLPNFGFRIFSPKI